VRNDGATLATTLAERIEHVRETIARAASRAGRRADEVTLVAVTKTCDAARVAEAARLGLTCFGENRVQEAEAKLTELRPLLAGDEWDRLDWHLIGHLQTNKARAAARLFSTIESVDGVRLAATLSRLGGELAATIPVLLEVNVGGEASKFGFTPEGLARELPEILALPHLAVRGLMTVAPLVPEPEHARTYFRALRLLRDRLVDENPTARLDDLSMGMTGDYAVAIEEGATIVRVGRAIFGERPV
jgi:PLP dependent protein